jgi:hypothetical protein
VNTDEIKELYRDLKAAREIRNWQEFSAKIGYDRAYLSSVVNGSKPLQPDMIAAIQRAFPKTTNNVAPKKQQVLSDGIEITLKEYLESIREQKRMAEEHRKSAEKHSEDLKNIIIAQLAGIDQKLTGVDSNLVAALAGVAKQAVHYEAASSTALESLARLEHKKQDALKKEADKRVFDKLREISGHRTNQKTHK